MLKIDRPKLADHTTHAAVIVETRIIHNLDRIIRQHMKHLSNEWRLFIFHHHNGHLFKDMDAIKINLGRSMDKYSYNRLLCSKEFWLQIPHEKILIFQHDSMLLRKGIDEFMQWDWIGAANSGWFNGGLSLRSRSKMIETIERIPYRGQPEDIYFHENIKKVGGKVPSHETASEFACEQHFKLGTLGHHQIHHHMSSNQINLINNQYLKRIKQI